MSKSVKDIIKMIEENDIKVLNRKVAILGSGGTFNTVKCVMHDLGAKEVYCISREKKEDTYTYDELYDLGVELLINTTPVGMYPNNYVSNIDLDKFLDKYNFTHLLIQPNHFLYQITNSSHNYFIVYEDPNNGFRLYARNDLYSDEEKELLKDYLQMKTLSLLKSIIRRLKILKTTLQLHSALTLHFILQRQ